MLRLFSFASFSFLCFLVEAAALRSIALRYAGAPIVTRVYFFYFFVYFEMSLSSSLFLYHFRFIFVHVCSMESTSYVLSLRMVFFYLVTTGWIFYVNLCKNSINQFKTSTAKTLTHNENTRGQIRLSYTRFVKCLSFPSACWNFITFHIYL